MPDLSFQIERYIVKKLACQADPDEIVDDVEDKFLLEIDTEDVQAYSPEVDGEALTPDLRDLYQYTRWEYLGGEEADEERTFVSVATTSEINGESLHCVDVADHTIMLFEKEGQYRALNNRCTHKGGPLCEGERSDDTVTCPWHGAEFDLDTGEPAGPPATEAVEAYDVRVQGDEIEVKI